MLRCDMIRFFLASVRFVRFIDAFILNHCMSLSFVFLCFIFFYLGFYGAHSIFRAGLSVFFIFCLHLKTSSFVLSSSILRVATHFSSSKRYSVWFVFCFSLRHCFLFFFFFAFKCFYLNTFFAHGRVHLCTLISIFIYLFLFWLKTNLSTKITKFFSVFHKLRSSNRQKRHPNFSLGWYFRVKEMNILVIYSILFFFLHSIQLLKGLDQIDLVIFNNKTCNKIQVEKKFPMDGTHG